MQISMSSKLLLATLLLLLTGPALSDEAVSPEQARAFMQSNGKRAAVVKYFSDEPGRFDGYKMVASGSSAWLSVGIDLMWHTDGAQRELMFDAIATAMPSNPSLVLPLVTEGNGRVLCLPLAVGNDDLKDWEPYLKKVTESLARVAEPSFQAAKAICLNEVVEVRAALKQAEQ